MKGFFFWWKKVGRYKIRTKETPSYILITLLYYYVRLLKKIKFAVQHLFLNFTMVLQETEDVTHVFWRIGVELYYKADQSLFH